MSSGSRCIGAGYKRNALISLAVFLAALVLVYTPASFDLPLTRLVNSFANRSLIADRLIYSLDRYFTFSGVVLVALVWACWFGTDDLEARSRILVGTLASFGAGIVSRFLQHKLPSHPRPFYDPTLGFHAPSVLGGTGLSTWNSFPSDHVAVFAGLVTVICLVRSRFSVFAIIWTTLVESSRTYVGAHYPSDLLGGAGLAATIVWTAQAPWIVSLGRRVVGWERLSPAIFYMCAFFVTFQIATLFIDIRNMTGGFSLLSRLG